MIHSGDWKTELGLLDQSVAMAMAGDDLRMSSDAYCNTIASCRNLGDYKRAGERTEEAERWMRSNSVTGYTGACQVHRAELKRLHASWLEAEDEARKAWVESASRWRFKDAGSERGPTRTATAPAEPFLTRPISSGGIQTPRPARPSNLHMNWCQCLLATIGAPSADGQSKEEGCRLTVNDRIDSPPPGWPGLRVLAHLVVVPVRGL